MAGKDFWKRLSRMIPSFQSCRNKDWNSLPPSPISLMFSAISVNCSCRSRGASRKVESKSRPEDTVLPPRQKIDFNVDRNDYTSTDGLRDADSTHGSVATSSDEEMFTMILHGKKQSMKLKTKKKKRGGTWKSSTPRPSCSLSARSGWFGSGECGEESMDISYLMSSSSSTSDSAELAVTKINKNNKKKKLRSSGMCKRPVAGEQVEFGDARVSAIGRRLPWKVAERVVRESMAVVKRLDDPYQNFCRSMLEMIREKKLEEEAGELEQLLQCFLSLNSTAHHPVILWAFSDIWDSLFPPPPTPGSSPVA